MNEYQWGPVEEPVKKKKSGFGKSLVKTIALALVFGLVAGVTMQAVYNSDLPFIEKKEQVVSETEKPKSLEEDISDKKSASTVTYANTVHDVSEIAENIMPAIVAVTNVSITEYRTFFGGTRQYESTSAGSGFIISQDNDYIYIATNNHVVNSAETLTITFCDGTAVEGQIKGTDSSLDLAVVAVNVSDIESSTLGEIKVATIGDSTALKVGQPAVVIGNALGYGQSVTSGVISATNREFTVNDESGNEVTNWLIQTDAAVNPGNSGGALLNMGGEVIGIVSAKYAETKVEGMGFAIPISQAASIIEQMINSEVVSEADAAFIGISGYDITSSVAQQYPDKNYPTGVYVVQVVAGSAADQSGIKKGDVITEFNGRKVTSMSTIENILKYIPAGTTVNVTIKTAASDYEEEVVKEVTLTHKLSREF